jgi:hypothetical protein
MSVDDLRNSVDPEKVVNLLKQFDGQSNIKALTTLACALGLLIGSENKSTSQLAAMISAVSFIINDSVQLALREGCPVIGHKEPPEDKSKKPTLN